MSFWTGRFAAVQFAHPLAVACRSAALLVGGFGLRLTLTAMNKSPSGKGHQIFRHIFLLGRREVGEVNQKPHGPWLTSYC